MTLQEEIEKWWISHLAVAKLPSRAAIIQKSIELTLERAAQEADQNWSDPKLKSFAQTIARNIRKLKG